MPKPQTPCLKVLHEWRTHNGNHLCDGPVDGGDEGHLQRVAVRVDRALDAVHAHVVRRLEHDLARVVAGLVPSEQHWQLHHAVVQVHVWKNTRGWFIIHNIISRAMLQSRWFIIHNVISRAMLQSLVQVHVWKNTFDWFIIHNIISRAMLQSCWFIIHNVISRAMLQSRWFIIHNIISRAILQSRWFIIHNIISRAMLQSRWFIIHNIISRAMLQSCWFIIHNIISRAMLQSLVQVHVWKNTWELVYNTQYHI